MTTWQDYLDNNQDRFLTELLDFIRIPSVSALPAHIPDVQNAAEWVRQRLENAGIQHTQIMPTGGHPCVYGDWLHAGDDKPTILIYGHFDVQPVDPIELWDNPPFEPVVKDERIYARGASDDKGGMLTPILAVEALLQSTGKLPVNVKFCFEGQEEIGSPQLADFIRDNVDKLACDHICTADGLLYEADRPMILTGLKGICKVELHVVGPKSDQHSGLAGGVLHNPIEALAQIIASMRHPDGTIAIDGFYDDVMDLTETERTAFAEIPYDAEAHRQALGIPEFFGEPGYTNRERNWARPTLDFNGIYGGFQGEGSKTVIPSYAHAKITCRLVANQDPTKIQDLIEAHVIKHMPTGVTVEVQKKPGSSPTYYVSPDHPMNQVVGEVLTEVFGVEPYLARVGGSIPIVSHFQKYLGANTFNFGWTCADENLHAPNEFFRLRNFERGQKAYCMLLERLAT